LTKSNSQFGSQPSGSFKQKSPKKEEKQIKMKFAHRASILEDEEDESGEDEMHEQIPEGQVPIVQALGT
jgi:hypothetical protein